MFPPTPNRAGKDLCNILDALEYFITDKENDLLDRNAGDREWQELEDYKSTLTVMQFIESIYG